MEVLIVMSILAGVGVFSYMLIFEKERYRRKYPLDTPIKVEIEREQLNNNYSQLSQAERELLTFTKDKNLDAYITREVRNRLILTIKITNGEPSIWRLYEGDSSDRWIEYIKKGYFKPTSIFEDIFEEVF